MTKKKFLIGAALAVGVIAISGAAIARPDGMRGGFPGKMMLRLFGDLDLTEQQELKAIRMRRALAEQGQEAKKETFKSLEPAIAELGKERPDARKLHLIADEAIARYSKIVHAAIDQAIDLHATLTPEQKSKLATRAKELHDRREERMEHREHRFEDKKPGKK